MNTIELYIRGLALMNPLSVSIAKRSLLIAPNESGKSTILNCLRTWATGKANMDSGNTPGALLTYCPPGGALTIDGTFQGIGASLFINKPRQTKVPIPDGWDCRMSDLLGLDGTAEKVKAFFAEYLRPGAEWTRESAQEAIVNKLREAKIDGADKFTIPPGRDVIDSMTQALKVAKAATSKAREKRDEADTLKKAATKDSQSGEVLMAGSVEELLNKRSELQHQQKSAQSQLDMYELEVAKYNRIQSAAKGARELYERKRDTAQRKDVAAIDAKIATATAEAEDAAKLVRDLQAHLNNLNAVVATSEKEQDAKREELISTGLPENSQHVEVMLNSGKCPTCSEGISADRLQSLVSQKQLHNLRLEEWKALCSETIKAKVKVAECERSLADAGAKLATARAAATNLNTSKTAALDFNKKCDESERDAEKAWKDAVSAAEGVNAPVANEELTITIARLAGEIANLAAPIAEATKRAEGRAAAARALEAFEKAAKAVEACKTTEEIISGVRDSIVRGPAAELASVCRRFAGALGALDIVLDPGDGESDPTIGARVSGHAHVVELSSFSAAKRSIFLASVAAALLERSKSTREKRILLIEAGAMDSVRLVELLHAIENVNIGFVVVAWHCAADFVSEFRQFIESGSSWQCPDWRTEATNVSN